MVGSTASSFWKDFSWCSNLFLLSFVWSKVFVVILRGIYIALFGFFFKITFLTLLNDLVERICIFDVCCWEYLVVYCYILHLLYVLYQKVNLKWILTLIKVSNRERIRFTNRVYTDTYFHFISV